MKSVASSRAPARTTSCSTSSLARNRSRLPPGLWQDVRWQDPRRGGRKNAQRNRITDGRVGSGSLTALPPSYSQTQGSDRQDRRDDRQDSRDTKQTGRQDTRDEKAECKEGDEKTRAECRQDKRDTKQDSRQDAREIKK